MMKHSFFVALFLWLPFSALAATDEHAQDHQALRKILAEVQEDINKKDFKSVEQFLRPDVVITFQDARVVKGINGASQYLEEKITGSNAVLKDHHLAAQADELSNIVGNTAIAHGSAVQDFQFTGGMQLTLDSKWTATLLKDNGVWKVAALHISASIFDNPILATAEKNLWLYALGGFIAGLLVFALGKKLFCKSGRVK